MQLFSYTAINCQSIACQNNGICARSNGVNMYTCNCLSGYTGVYCELGEFSYGMPVCLLV